MMNPSLDCLDATYPTGQKHLDTAEFDCLPLHGPSHFKVFSAT